MNESASPRSVNDQSTRVQAHFARASRDWGSRYQEKPQGMADLDLHLRRAVFQRLLGPLIDGSDGPVTILDIGCGSGHVLDGVARDLIRVVGVDFVPEMLIAAASQHLDDRFLAADVCRLPVAATSVQVVTCSGVLEYVADPAAALKAMAHVLKPGGNLIASFPNRASIFRRLVAVERGCERAAVRIRDALIRRNSTAIHSTAYRQRQWTVNQARSLVELAGLRSDRVLLCTIGPWGRFGRLRPMLKLSAKLTGEGQPAGFWQRRTASTIVIRAHKP